MALPDLTSSAALHLRLSAFGAVFTVLAVGFEPMFAYALAVAASIILAKL